MLETLTALLKLPDLGPIGSNGLANPRDFETPVAAWEDVEGDFELVANADGSKTKVNRTFITYGATVAIGKPIAMKDLNAQVSFEGDRMVWVIPPAEQGRILARTAAIFMGHEDGRFVWVRR